MIRPVVSPLLEAKNRVIIALDFPSGPEADRFLSHWDGRDKPFVKVGMQLFYAAGPTWVAKLVETGYKVFLDLKLHDIPHTVAGAVRSVASLGVDLLTLHASGGRRMMESAREGLEAKGGANRLQLLAVTRLTHIDQKVLNDELEVPGAVRDSVLNLAHLAQLSGMDGVVCSGEEVSGIKEKIDRQLLTVTPGIRLKGQDPRDQKRVMTPETAIQEGADLLVVGRPITQAPGPVAVWEKMIADIQETGRDDHERAT